ncbi:MAG: sugar phosphate isomerase/epimerase family protein [Candidatus Zipacnadales bacterium]
MSDIKIGINLEFVRSADMSFKAGIEKAAEIGYQYVEPCVATGYDLLAIAGYYHMVSMEDDPLEVKEWLDALGLKCSGLSAHSALMRPDVSVPYITQAIRYAADVGAPVVNTDEGPKPDWMDETLAFEIMRYSLHQILAVAERHGIAVAIEPHQIYTSRLNTFERILSLSDSPCLKVNWDTGNIYLAGKEDPYEMLEALADRVVHVHAKDIAFEHGAQERGQVTGTAVGCACGDGVVDWPRVIEILRAHGYNGVLSVECGTVEQAAKSLDFLKRLV